MKETNEFDRDERDSTRALTEEELRHVTGGEDEEDSSKDPRRTNDIWCQSCNIKTSHHRTPDGKYACDICGTVNWPADN